MKTITRLTNAADIRAARAQFEDHVGADVYREQYHSMGQAFKVESLIGRKKHVFIQCEENGQVVGLAYGHPQEDETFFIAEVISAPGSHAGSAMIDWFADRENVEMPGLTQLELVAAEVALRGVYAKPWYGFTLVNEQSGRMARQIR